MVDMPNPGLPAQGTAGGTDVVTALYAVVRQLSAWVAAYTGRTQFGAFTLTSSSTTTVNDTAVRANSWIGLSPTNAAAANLPVYVSARSAGTSFTVATGSGSPAAGSETFSYVIITPG